MTEQELVQEALGRLPRPAQPLCLHKTIMAQVQAEAWAESAGQQAWIWSRTEEDGKTIEWRQGRPAPMPAPMPFPPASVIHTTQQRQDAAGITIYTDTWEQ